MLCKWSDSKRTGGQKKILYYYFVYTLCFTATAAVIYCVFALNGKSFVQKGDALLQHFNCLAYYGGYLRTIIHELFLHGKWSIPQWDFHIGYGMDILTTLNYYVIGDPLNLLSVFFSPQKTEYLYDGLVLLRMYLAGTSFSALCFYYQKSRFGVLVGALVYVFCGYALLAGVKHPFFINPMIYLPIILLGIEKIVRKEKPYLFIFSIALSAISNFYFFYILSALSCLYIFFRQMNDRKGKKKFEILLDFIKMAGYYLTGILLGAFLFIPTLYAFFNCGRFDSGYQFFAFLYRTNYYKTFLIDFVNSNTSDYLSAYWTILGFGSIAFFSVIVIFCQNGRYKTLKSMFLFALLLLCIPFAGYAFNGFAYVSNRWVFGFSLLVAFIVATAAPKLCRLNRKEMFAIAACVVLYGIFILLYRVNKNNSSYFSFGILAIGIIALFVIDKMRRQGKQLTAKRVQTIILLIAIISSCASGFIRYSRHFGDYVSGFCESGQVFQEATCNQNANINKFTDSRFYRVDSNTDYYSRAFHNNSLLLKYNSTSAYFSLIDSKTVQYFSDMNIPLPTRQSLPSLDSRAELEAVSGVTYYIADSKKAELVPYGFYQIGSMTAGGSNYVLYQNKNPLPLGFTYSSFIKSDVYESLPAEKKQQAMLQGVVLEKSVDGYRTAEPVYGDIAADCSTRYNRNEIEIENGIIAVKKPGAKITLLFEPETDSECYLKMTGLSFVRSMQPHELKQIGSLNDIPYKKINNSEMSIITVSSSKTERLFDLRTPESSYYTNQHDFLIHMGYSSDGINKIAVSFERTGIYKFNKMVVIYQPMKNIDRQIDALKTDIMESETIGVNKVSGTVNLKTDKILFLSIPYNKGWRAKVNGKPADILAANVHYMAIPLKTGVNKLELQYETPLLKISASISTATFLILLMFITGLPSAFFSKTKRKFIERI